MGIKLAAIDEGERITLQIHSGEQTLELGATVKKHIKENIILIGLDYTGQKRLSFETVKVDAEYNREGDVPIVWHNAKVVSFKEDYVIQAPTDGVRHNRRNSFRVAVAKTAQFRMTGRGALYVMIRDISITGFSIADRKKDLALEIGNNLSVSFEDLGHKLDLAGRVVRIEEREDMIIYGMEITNLCKDLSSYVNLKQRRNRTQA
ncbi:MAG: PilZ domain-containing protein [Lachnospiraceae bacterium]|nr:PilZ domain-containing protein [Lachnospiraceae bacterium]